MTPQLPAIRDALAKHGIVADKRLGQHFLLDLNLTGRIARAAGAAGPPLTEGTTIEIGPGPGGLTRALLEAGADVIGLERDTRVRPVLEELAEAYPGKLDVRWGDALRVNAAALGATPRRIVANLPYNIGTELLIGWLRDITAFASLTLMFQTEVAERLVARPSTKSYGRLSILTQWLCDARILFTVTPKAFVPPPQVESAVVQLIPRSEPLAPAPMATLERVTAAAFGQRRKMLRQSLKALGTAAGMDGQTLCVAAEIDPTDRAENLSVADFCRIANALEETART